MRERGPTGRGTKAELFGAAGTVAARDVGAVAARDDDAVAARTVGVGARVPGAAARLAGAGGVVTVVAAVAAGTNLIRRPVTCPRTSRSDRTCASIINATPRPIIGSLTGFAPESERK